MASQARSSGASWSEYLRRKPVRDGWNSIVEGQPFNADYSLVRHEQCDYEAGRQMALESGMKYPTPAGRITNEIKAVQKAIPAFYAILATQQRNAREEAKRAAALRLKFRHHQQRKAA